MKNILTLTFLAFCFLSNAQLIDPFGKIVTHEIKLTKLEDGAYMGAMEWTTGGIDSLQRFVINDLDIKAPVMVRIISKAPNHNIDLSFYKKNWEDVESTISTDGDKFTDKIFRTMGMAGIGVSSKVAGIPYLIIVKVGLQFPSTKSLIRITDDIEEYKRYLQKKGISGNVYLDTNTESSNEQGLASSITGKNNNTLLYIVIGLLALIIVLLCVFLLRKQKSKTMLMLVLSIGFGISAMAQYTNAPKPVPIGNPIGEPVFVDYRTSNVANQNPTAIENPRVRDTYTDTRIGDSGVLTSRTHVRIESNPESRELSRQEIEDLNRRMQEGDEQFDRDYRDNMPGEPTDGDLRIPPINQTQEELEQLRRQVRQLQREVARLSLEDEEYEEDQSDDDTILVHCEYKQECQSCLNNHYRKFIQYQGYFGTLQRIYLNKMRVLQGRIANAHAVSSIPGAGLGYPQVRNKALTSIDKVRMAYNNKFDEYIETMQQHLEKIENCYQNHEVAFDEVFVRELHDFIRRLESSRIYL